MNLRIFPIMFVVGLFLLMAYTAFGTNDTSDIPDTVDLGEPNTVVIFCEWNYNQDFVHCIQDRYWHNDNLEVIGHETSHYSISIQEYRNGEL